MRRNLVVGNWKMNGSASSAANLIKELKQLVLAESAISEVAVCPPYIFIPTIANELVNTPISLGAQNVHEKSEGAYTGEISALMLAEANCKFVIIGHSERRTLFSETDSQVAAKFLAAQAANIIPIVCLGESLELRNSGQALAWVEGQLQAVIDSVGIQALSNVVLAYEPIWAIGTGKTATPEQAQEVHAHIRLVIARQDEKIAESIQILYGGSVNSKNANELFAQQDIDGALVGGASLKSQDFIKICIAAA